MKQGPIDVEETSVDGPDDVQGLDASAAHIVNLLSSEPSDVRLGIGGFSMGAATAFHSAACYAHGRFSNGVAYPTLSAIIGLSGWLPCSRTLRTKIESSQTAFRRAAALPIMLGHGRGDEAVTYRNGERSAEFLRNSGFSYLNFKAYNGYYRWTCTIFPLRIFLLKFSSTDIMSFVQTGPSHHP
uniref:Phospholipase/carboxylesterase/thioesterase domain-containing protein n=1 Tax=Aegilops tauschii subsp. strangulata TaxID=200361 RepID=A0A453DGB2_AEGTS